MSANISLIGNLGKEPETKITDNGTFIANFSIASNTVKNTADGKVAWKRIEGVDFEFLGYFLSCHLIIEYYLEQYLRTKYPELGWEGSRLTFAQKISLLSTEYLPEKYKRAQT